MPTLKIHVLVSALPTLAERERFCIAMRQAAATALSCERDDGSPYLVEPEEVDLVVEACARLDGAFTRLMSQHAVLIEVIALGYVDRLATMEDRLGLIVAEAEQHVGTQGTVSARFTEVPQSFWVVGNAGLPSLSAT